MNFSDYKLTKSQARALEFFRSSLKSSGIWDKIDLLYVGCVSDEDLARTNLVNPGQFYLKPREGAVHLKGLGWTSLTDDGYVETGFNLLNDRVSYDRDSAFILAACPQSAYQLGDTPGDAPVAGTSAAGSTSYFRINPVRTSSNGRARINSDTSRDFSTTSLTPPSSPRPVVGVASRGGASSFEIYYGSEKTREVDDVASTTIPDCTVWLCRDEITGSASRKPISVYAMGGYLSENESLTLSRLVDDLYVKLVYPGIGLSEFDCQNIDIPIRTRVFRSENSSDDSDLIVVQHGNGRNMEAANRSGWPIAGRFGKIVVSFEFDSSRFSGSQYHRIGLTDSGGTVQPESEWLTTIMNRCLDEVRDRLGASGQRQILWGHSAGGQAAHRSAMFAPGSFDAFVAANSGYYTALNEDFDYPYGLSNLPSEMKDNAALQAMLAAHLTIYIGTEDNTPYTEDPEVSSDPGAVAQGDNRYARAYYMYNTAQQLAASNEWTFNWEIVEADGIGHSSRGMGSRSNVPVGD